MKKQVHQSKFLYILTSSVGIRCVQDLLGYSRSKCCHFISQLQALVVGAQQDTCQHTTRMSSKEIQKMCAAQGCRAAILMYRQNAYYFQTTQLQNFHTQPLKPSPQLNDHVHRMFQSTFHTFSLRIAKSVLSS